MRKGNRVEVGGVGNVVTGVRQSIGGATNDGPHESPLHRVRMLFVSARGNQGFLESDREARAIREAWMRSEAQLDFATDLAASSAELRRAVLVYHPEIVHFSGHGSRAMAFHFEDDEAGDGDLVSPKYRRAKRTWGLRELLVGEGLAVRLVIFNSCDSWTIASRVAESVGATIGMNGAISDQAAIAFSRGLHASLALGEPLGAAFRQGLVALANRFPQESQIPRLAAGREQPEALRFVEPEEG
jgi:hypothetical protein